MDATPASASAGAPWSMALPAAMTLGPSAAAVVGGTLRPSEARAKTPAAAATTRRVRARAGRQWGMGGIGDSCREGGAPPSTSATVLGREGAETPHVASCRAERYRSATIPQQLTA